jgi:TPR repeat protein
LLKSIKHTSLLFVIILSTSTSAFAEQLTNLQYEAIPRLKSHYMQKVNAALLALNAKKYDKAYQKMSSTARWGHKESQFYLATMYLQGQGTTQDIPKAWIWLNLALEQRNSDWIIMKRKLAKYIPEQAQQVLEKEIDDYRDRYGAEAKGLSCKATKVVGSNRVEERCERQWMP